MTLNGVRALVFDVFGTVVDWRSGVAREAAPFLTRYGTDEVEDGTFTLLGLTVPGLLEKR